MSNPYEEATGIENATRKDYLDQLAEEWEIDNDVVYTLADLLGPNEDFDGLVSHVQDEYERMHWL